MIALPAIEVSRYSREQSQAQTAAVAASSVGKCGNSSSTQAKSSTRAKSECSLPLRSELVRYRQFLGIQKEQQNIKEEQAKLKQSFAQGKDIVSPDNLNTINQAKAEGTPADRCRTLYSLLHSAAKLLYFA